MIRFPVGGFVWHHFQYLAGLDDLRHEVIYFEDYGWKKSCYDPSCDLMSGDPGYGIAYLQELLRRYGLEIRWCYLAEDGTAHGMSREELADCCRDADIYLDLSNVNSIPESALCRRRVLVDTDPVFTQIGVLGSAPLSDYDVLFTFGENVHQPGCTMPTADRTWLPTRQPVVTRLWPVEKAQPDSSFTTVMSWDPTGDHRYGDQVFGGKARAFGPFLKLPQSTGESMEIAINVLAKIASPTKVYEKLTDGGWRVRDAAEVTQTPWCYQKYLQRSRAEFSVSKHGYVVTQCGWFSERSAAYLASGRPVVLQDTGFSKFLPCGEGLLAYRDRDEAIAAIEQMRNRYEDHCRTARALAEEFFDSRRVLSELLERSV
jgi:hypothetical protein